eukprot:jgi/Ulvmu1/6697/UM030_0028.1
MASRLATRSAARLMRLERPQLRVCRSSACTARADHQDRLLRSLSANQEVAVLAVDGLGLVSEAHERHKTAPTATAALGRALLGSLLMGCFRKDKESLQITFAGEGALKGVQVIAESSGFVKGKVGNPLCDLPVRDDGKLDVGRAVGPGTLAVVRTQPLSPQPYTGTVEITSGEIAEDLAVYMSESEQTNGAVALGVQIGPAGEVTAAGGYLVQVLPFASDETLSKLEANIAGLPAVTDVMAMGMTLERLTEVLLEGIGVDAQHVSTMTPAYGPCDKEGLQERMKRAVAALGDGEAAKLMEEQGKIEVTCQFCADTYQFTEAEVESAAQKA